MPKQPLIIFDDNVILLIRCISKKKFVPKNVLCELSVARKFFALKKKVFSNFFFQIFNLFGEKTIICHVEEMTAAKFRNKNVENRMKVQKTPKAKVFLFNTFSSICNNKFYIARLFLIESELFGEPNI
jgi:hypothetical protein